MTLEEIAESLPNGFHDAEITRIEIDYSNRRVRLEMAVWVGSMDDPPDRREAYRSAIVIVSGLNFCSLELPDAKYSFREGENIVIDAVLAKEQSLPKDLLATLADGEFAQTFFVRDWNSFIRISGKTAELSWASEQVNYR